MRSLGSCLVALGLVAAACTAEPAPTAVPVVPTMAVATTTTTTTIMPTATAVPDPTATAPGPPSTTNATVTLEETVLAVETVGAGFAQPVHAIASGGRLFVVDQPGRIWEIDGVEVREFLDIREPVSFGGERGLLSMAFHPEHDDLFYVNYTGLTGATKIVEFQFDEDGADAESSRELLSISQPARNHNGGMIAFGPDGNLWIGMGDGGASNDRFGNGQRGDTLLASMLRIEVGPEVTPYGVAEDYGFEAAEVWAIGMRNPWRFAFDGRDLWIADVGQSAWEEINKVSVDDRGLNFGWPLHEGTSCYRGGSQCDSEDLTPPIHEYKHPEGCSITGGYVYRGQAMPQLSGHYFFSDFCSGFIRSIAPSGELFDWTDQIGAIGAVTSFGLDPAGELLILSGNGTVYRVVPG